MTPGIGAVSDVRCRGAARRGDAGRRAAAPAGGAAPAAAAGVGAAPGGAARRRRGGARLVAGRHRGVIIGLGQVLVGSAAVTSYVWPPTGDLEACRRASLLARRS